MAWQYELTSEYQLSETSWISLFTCQNMRYMKFIPFANSVFCSLTDLTEGLSHSEEFLFSLSSFCSWLSYTKCESDTEQLQALPYWAEFVSPSQYELKGLLSATNTLCIFYTFFLSLIKILPHSLQWYFYICTLVPIYFLRTKLYIFVIIIELSKKYKCGKVLPSVICSWHYKNHEILIYCKRWSDLLQICKGKIAIWITHMVFALFPTLLGILVQVANETVNSTTHESFYWKW